MQIALIGIGKIANYQMQAITHTPGIKLIDAHDLDPGKAEELPGSVQFHDNLEKMFKTSRANAYLVSTPTPTHYDVAMRVIEAGRIAIVEKPLCTSKAEMEALIKAARIRRLPLYTAFHPAYGREVEWWREQREMRNFELGALLGFDTCFAEPYIVDGKLTIGAAGKAGAWIDNGASCLSALSRLVEFETMQLIEGRMTVIPALKCAQVQGLGLYRFVEQGRAGFGLVDTNWTLGRHDKITRLRYENGTVELDHSRELAVLSQDGHEPLTFNLATDKPRLVNHYCGVFSDLTAMFSRGEDNTRLSEVLHRLLFAAMNH